MAGCTFRGRGVGRAIPEHGPENVQSSPGQGKGLRVPVFGDLLADQGVQLGEFLVEGGGDQFPEVLGRDGGVLGFRRVHCGPRRQQRSGHRVSSARLGSWLRRLGGFRPGSGVW